MNPIPFNSFSTTMALALPDAGRVAQEAIAHNDMARLQRMMDAAEVDGHTRTTGQRTLLIESVHHLNADAFARLTRLPDGYDVNAPDAEGNTVMHHLALRMTDDVLDNGRWENVLEAFLESAHGNIDWDQENDEGRTALALTLEDERTSFAVLVDPYAPDEPGSARGEHAENDTDEDLFDDVESEHFENLNDHSRARVQALHEKFLQQKRHS